MARLGAFILASVALAACADVAPHLTGDGQPKNVADADLQWLLAAARHWVHSGGLSPSILKFLAKLAAASGG